MPEQFWSWTVVIDFFLGGVAAGVMIISVAVARAGKARSRAFRLLPFAAPVLLSVAMLMLFLDLENKLHAFRFFTSFRITSPMSWGSWILAFVIPATVLYGLSRLTEHERTRFTRLIGNVARWADAHAVFLARANVVLGIALGTYTGVLLSTSASPVWASIVVAPLFLASSIATGAAFCKLVSLNGEEQGCVCRYLLIAMAAEVALLFAYFIDLRGTRTLFFGGPYTAAMWSLVVIAGLFVPAFVQFLELRRRVRPVLLAPALILAGGLALRWIIVSAGQA